MNRSKVASNTRTSKVDLFRTTYFSSTSLSAKISLDLLMITLIGALETTAGVNGRLKVKNDECKKCGARLE
jgi:hypothetical protein